MPAKKAAPAKKETATRKTSSGRKPAGSGTPVAKGDVYECEVCGLSVVVDEECGCEEVCDIMCCNQPMKEKKARVRSKTAK